MAKRFTKSLLLTGLGLMGLTVVLWGIGKVIAERGQAQMDAKSAAFLQQFPKIGLNDSAETLDRRMTALGLSPSSQNSDVAPSEEAQQAFQAIRDELTDYLDQQIQKTHGPLDPVPAQLLQYVQAHRAELLAVQQHLITAEQPTWELDVEVMADFSYAYPSFLPLTQLNHLLLLQAIANHNQGNTSEMMLAIEASTAIPPSLFQRPDLISNLVGLILNRQQAGVLRHLDAIPSTFAERLVALDQQQALVRSLNFENWMTYGSMKRLVRDRESWEAMAQEEGIPGLPLHLPKLYFTLSNLNTTQALEQTYRQLPERNICTENLTELDETLMVKPAFWNQLGQIAMPGFLRQWQKGGMGMLELEMTQKVLEVKALAAENGGQWPGSLPDSSSAVCPGEEWVYGVTPEGAMTLSFSHSFGRLPKSEQARSLPLVYHAQAKSTEVAEVPLVPEKSTPPSP